MNVRQRLILWCTVAGLLIAAQFGGRMISAVAYAFERGQMQAVNEELAQLNQELVGLETVSRAIKLVARNARPGVVQVRVSGGTVTDEEAEARVRSFEENHGGPDSLPEEERKALKRFFRRQPESAGSGIIMDRDGHVLTNNHVVGGRDEISVFLYDDREYDAVLVGADPKTDLAVLKIDAPNLHPVPFGNSDAVEIGDWVVAIGAPFGLTQTVTHGIVSAVGRVALDGIDIEYQNFIQTDAAINPGNSGGPLLNLRGEVIGVNTAIATDGTPRNAGVAFVIPTRTAIRVARDLKAGGEVQRGWLGVSLEDLDASDVAQLGLERPDGVAITAVFGGMPGAEAGLEVDDVIIRLDDDAVRSVAQLRGLIAERDPGTQAKVTILRDGQELALTARLDRQPENIVLAVREKPNFVSRPVPKLDIGVVRFRTSSRRAGQLGYEKTVRGLFVWETGSLPNVGDYRVLIGCDEVKTETFAELQNYLADKRPGETVTLKLLHPTGDILLVKHEIK